MPLHDTVHRGLLDKGAGAPMCYRGFPEKRHFGVYLAPALFAQTQQDPTELGTELSQNRMGPASPGSECHPLTGKKAVTGSWVRVLEVKGQLGQCIA